MKSGKPSKVVAPPAAKKPAPAAAKASPPAVASPPAAASKSVAKPSPAKESAPTDDDDDPFGVDTAMASRAIVLSARPSKGKTVRLICPMCETPGFAGHEAAGKEVKCCNESCALPIFTAPKAEATVEPKADTRGSKGTATVVAAKKASAPLIMTAAGTLVMAIGSLWYFVFNESGPVRLPPPPPRTGGNSSNVATTLVDPDESEKAKQATKAEKSVAEKAAELRAQILPVIVDQARKNELNRSRHLCRRLAAEAYIEAGDIKTARESLDQLLTLPPKLPFHRVLPLAQIAWHELIQGNADAAKAALDEAVAAAPELPESGRLTFDATTYMAAILVMTGRTDEAKQLIGKYQPTSGSSGQLAALIRRAELLQTFDLDEGVVSLPVIAWKKPEWIVTTVTLVLRGHSDKALTWIKAAPDEETKADCFASWGDAIVVVPKSASREGDDVIAAAIREESPATQARVWARVATARAALKLKAPADKALANAAAAARVIALPSDLVLPEIKELSRLKLPDALAPRLNAIAVAEVARAQSLLGQTKPAEESLAAALQHLRGHAPSPFAAQRLFEATSRDNAADVRAELKKALNLKTEDQVNRALADYRAKCLAALNAANARFALQTEFLKAAVDWPLVDAVWSEATSRAMPNTPEESREEFLKTNLSVRLGHRLRAADQPDQARQCETAVTNGAFTDQRDALERDTLALLESGNVTAIAKQMVAYQSAKPTDAKPGAVTEDSDWPILWTMRFCARLTKQGKADKAFELIAAFDKDMSLREDGYELVAAMVAKNYAAAEPLWKKYRPSLITPTEKAALFRGLCAGLSTVATPAK